MAKNYPWYDEWIQRKNKYARTTELWMDPDQFNSIAIGTGMPDICQRSTFPFKNVKEGSERFIGKVKGKEKPFARIYTRLGNPTTEYLERVIFRLECQHLIDNALAAGEKKPTIGSLVTSSGMGAINCAMMALLRSGDEVLTSGVYGCTDSLFRVMQEKFGIKFHFLDMADLDLVREKAAECGSLAAIYVETPQNPSLQIADLQELSKIAEAHRIPLVVDNTFATSYLQQPFRLGADIVLHSMTKYINGHSTSIGGCLLGPWDYMQQDVFLMLKDTGPTPSPMDSWLNALGLQTLGLRMEKHCENAQSIANFLEQHPRVSKVIYPGNPSFSQHDLAMKQMRSGGGMISFELDAGFESARKLMNYFAGHDTPMELAVSLGAVISYIQHPASMTHAHVPEAEKQRAGITDSLIRMSVGLEGKSVLIDSLEKGLKLCVS